MLAGGIPNFNTTTPEQPAKGKQMQDTNEIGLLNFFARNIAPKVSKGAARLYHGLHVLELRQGGLCQPITTSERDVERDLFISRNSLREYCPELANAGAIEYLQGQGVLGNDAKGLQLRRRTLAELHSQKFAVELQPHTPADAGKICETLNKRGFLLDGKEVRPHFAARSTGRIYTTGANVQGTKREIRLEKLHAGLPPDKFIVEVDFRQADATVARVVLDRDGLMQAKEWPSEVYQHCATLLGIPRDDTKELFNKLLYCVNSAAYVNALNIARDPFLQKLAAALDAKKTRLWQTSRPKGKQPARIHTLGGTLVEGCNGGRRKKIHKGTLFNWIVQGTVADILNAATVKLLDAETEKGGRLLFPLHDSVVMMADYDCGKDVPAIMEGCASALGIPLKTKTTIFPHGANLSREADGSKLSREDVAEVVQI
jgi:hypothetical protein